MRKRLKSGAGVLFIAGALLLAACGSSTPTRAVARRPSALNEWWVVDHHLELHVHADVAHVAPGATVNVTNKDSATHTLTATGGQFDTGNITQNQTKTFTAPSKPGTYHYICNIHQYMMGTIVVK